MEIWVFFSLFCFDNLGLEDGEIPLDVGIGRVRFIDTFWWSLKVAYAYVDNNVWKKLSV